MVLTSPQPPVYDVIVIGAGLAGLYAARQLQRGGLRVLVVEARDRVGGRTLSQTVNGITLDMGAQWIGSSHHRALRLVDDYNIPTFKTRTFGRDIYSYDGQLFITEPTEIHDVLRRLDEMGLAASQDGVWKGAPQKDWYERSLADWLTTTPYADATKRYVSRLLAGSLLGTSADTLSLREVVFYLFSNHGSQRLVSTEGAQKYCVVGGTQTLATHIATEIGHYNVRLGEPVKQIEHSQHGATVHTARGKYSARYTIVTVPPAVLGHIMLKPQLPAAHLQAIHSIEPGNALKVHLLYDRPFWRDSGLSGIYQSDSGDIYESFDTTPLDATNGILTIFSYGHEANRLRALTPTEKKARILQSVAAIYGSEAHDVRAVASVDWSHETWTRGAFSGHLKLGSSEEAFRLLRKPVGPLYWAGTEVATEWNGYMEGALASGEAVAQTILEAQKRV